MASSWGKNTQESVLLDLVQGLEGRAWASLKNGWKHTDVGDTYICMWDYVECDAYGTTVTGINMVEADFAGTLPEGLGRLTTLEKLSMPRNLIRGTIPKSISNLPHLEVLNLNSNMLVGTIPTFASFRLRVLDLGHNGLVGTLDSDLVKHNPLLAELDASNNQLSGTVPSSFGDSQHLLTVSLSGNYLSGTIDASLFTIPTLNFLYLDDNRLMGTIPSEDLPSSPSLSSVSQLQELWLQQNFLTGTIPASIGRMDKLFSFYVDRNKLTGTVPAALCTEKINEEFFDTADQSQSRDYCDSVACPPGTFSAEGMFPCVRCRGNTVNPWLGRVDECVDVNEFDILKKFHDATHGRSWDGVRWDLDSVGAETLYCDELEGVACNSVGNVVAIELPAKGLAGTIPEDLGHLEFLERLDLRDNRLRGALPPDLRLAPLRVLEIGGNRLRGIVPHVLCRKEGVNNNGRSGRFDCDYVTCPAGTRAPKRGRRADDGDGREKCAPCPRGQGSPFLGSRKCSALFDDDDGSGGGRGRSSGALRTLAVFVALSLCVAGVLTYLRWKENRRRRIHRVEEGEESERSAALSNIQMTPTAVQGHVLD